MRKVPTVFVREYTVADDGRIVTKLLPQVTPGCEWALEGAGTATRKYDGQAVLIRRDGLAASGFVRRQVKEGKAFPVGFITADVDERTGTVYGWEPAAGSAYAKPLTEAMQDRYMVHALLPGTYELIGPTINRNPEHVTRPTLIKHTEAEPAHLPAGVLTLEVCRGILTDLANVGWEGIVWHHPDGRLAKLKARDFHVQRGAS